MPTKLTTLVRQTGDWLKQHDALLTTAESCTGGWIAQAMTSVAGSSEWFDRGFVTYSNISKIEMLGVTSQTLARYGAVSEETVREMVLGALQHSAAQVAVAVSGIAGPGGGSARKPVGTVCFAWAKKGDAPLSRTEFFSGERKIIRRIAVFTAIEGILSL